MTDYKPRQCEERRSDRRTTAVYWPFLIETEDIAGFCLLRNISSEGMTGRFRTEFAENIAVTVQFNALLSAHGKVSSSKDQMIKIQFATPIDVTTILHGLSTSPLSGTVRRAHRLQMQANIEIVLDGRTVPVEVRDISQKAFKVGTARLRSGDEIPVLLNGLGPQGAVVRWTQPQLAGLNFTQPLAFDQLGEWIIRLNDKAVPRSTRSETAPANLGRIS